MGTVLLARDTKLDRLVALKVLLARGDHWVQRFLAEAQATARCRHENIVAIHDVDEAAGHPYLVLEYVEGRTLRDFLEQLPSGPGGAPARVPVDLALETAVAVVRALGCAHAQGVVHRDLKPENVLLADTGAIKVFDFGIASRLGAEDFSRMVEAEVAFTGGIRLTRPGALVGTLPYMSPEQLRAEEVDARSDLWAAGVVLHEMVTGTHPLAPFPAGWQRRAADADVPIPSAAERYPELGPLGGVIDRCLEKRKGRRIGSAAELLAELERSRGDARGPRSATAQVARRR